MIADRSSIDERLIVAEPTTIEAIVAEPTVVDPTTIEAIVAEPTVVDPIVAEPTVVEPTVVDPTTIEAIAVESTVDDSANDAELIARPLESPPMTEPRVPGDDRRRLSLPCGESIDPHRIDLGMREFRCDCGQTHAVVLDVHPPARFFPESFVEVLRETIDTADEFEEFGTPHLLAIAMEEFPEAIVSHDAGDDGTVGYALCWIADFDARRLHEIVVELVVELMDHAVSHADDDAAVADFEAQLADFDVEAFVEEYRSIRDFDRGGR